MAARRSTSRAGKAASRPRVPSAKRSGLWSLGLRTTDAARLVRLVQAGLDYQRLEQFQQTTGLPWETLSRFVAIPKRTLTRRQSGKKLKPDESDRLLRASRIFQMAVGLFEGDVEAASRWLQQPQRGLGGAVPLDFAATDVGAREVESLIGRLEHGVFT